MRNHEAACPSFCLIEIPHPQKFLFGRLSARAVSCDWRWKKSCQEANFLVSYTKKDTNDSALGGRDEALELAAHNYGRDEWWLLLDPVSG